MVSNFGTYVALPRLRPVDRIEGGVSNSVRCGSNAAGIEWANDMQANSMRDAEADHASTNKVLIVEDDLIIALDMEDMVTELGFEVAGLASSLEHALHLAPSCSVAFVDVNLSDGASGPAVGKILAETFGISVVFVTGNSETVAAGVQGTLGVVSKPVSPQILDETLRYIVARRSNEMAVVPSRLKVFQG